MAEKKQIRETKKNTKTMVKKYKAQNELTNDTKMQARGRREEAPE